MEFYQIHRITLREILSANTNWTKSDSKAQLVAMDVTFCKSAVICSCIENKKIGETNDHPDKVNYVNRTNNAFFVPVLYITTMCL